MMLPKNLYNLYRRSTGICTDSRQAATGMIFFALRGENFNGNEYARAALEKGCTHAVIDDPAVQPDSDAFIVVGDVLATLQALATHHRKTLGIPVLAITGSNGKTTTRELIHAVLSKKFSVLATTGNLNNHIGVPLTLLKLKDEGFAVIEMGANHRGEIHSLCTIADPDYGIITNIGHAHLEGFGSPEGVRKAKAELYQYLAKKYGTVFINGKNEILKKTADPLNLNKIWYIGGPDPLCTGYTSNRSVFPEIILSFPGSNEYKVHTRLTGTYNLENILAAACTGKFFGVDEAKIVEALEAYTPSNNRSQLLQTSRNNIIVDAYNANPTSMRNAILNFMQIEAPSKLLILGDMLELGQYSEKEHLGILQLLEKTGAQHVLLVGPQFTRAATGTPCQTFYVVEDLIEHLRLNPVTDQLILLKGSRGMKLEKLIGEL